MLTKTWQLINRLSPGLTNGSISDEDLKELFAEGTFTRSAGEGYLDPGIVSNENHSKLDAIKDFVQTVAEQMHPDVLHALTGRLLFIAPNEGLNTFLRNSCLAKTFLAWEMSRYPAQAEGHFHSGRMQQEFSTEAGVGNLKQVILAPLVAYFKNPTEVSDAEAIWEARYPAALLQLQELGAPRNEGLGDKIRAVIAHVEALKQTGQEPVSELHRALESTYRLLTDDKDMTVHDYNDIAAGFQGAGSPGMRLLGALMIAVSVLVMSLSAVAGGAGLFVGFGLFAKGRERGLAKAAHELVNVVDQENHEAYNQL